jgi:hypothetical protein
LAYRLAFFEDKPNGGITVFSRWRPTEKSGPMSFGAITPSQRARTEKGAAWQFKSETGWYDLRE